MIDDLTLKARIMAADQNNIEKNAMLNRREKLIPGYGNSKYGKNQFQHMKRTGKEATSAFKEQTTQEKQNANLLARQNQAANSPNMIYPTKAPAPTAASKIGGSSGTPVQNRTSLSTSNDAQQKYLEGQGVGQLKPQPTVLHAPGANNDVTKPDSEKVTQEIKHGPDGASEVKEIKTQSNADPKPTAELDGLGANPSDTPDLPPDTSQTASPAPAIPGSMPQTTAQTQQPLGGPMPQTAPTGAPAPPPPNMTAPLPPLNTGHMNTGGQQNNPVFNIGTGQGQGQGQAPAAPQNDPKTNAKNMQVANATQRSNTKGGIGTGLVSNVLTGGLAGVARGAYNAYERGQGRQDLARLAKSPYSKVLSVFEIRKGISARNTTEVLRRGRI